MDKVIGWTVIVLGCLAVIVGISALIALPVMLLWNWLMPMIFGLQQLTFLQSWGLLILSNCLFKSTNYNSKSN